MNVSSKNAPSIHHMPWDHPPKIDIVEGDASSRTAIESFLRREGFHVRTFGNGEGFLDKARQDGPEIALIDIRLPGLGGIETTTRLKKRHPETAIIFLSDESSADICAQAARYGAYDIILRPFQRTCLITAIRNALQKRELLQEMRKLKSELRLRYDFTGIIGSTPSMTRLAATLKRLAASDVPVLLHGEKGSGKELAARTIHYNSRFADGPFVCVNCSVLREDLIGSEPSPPDGGSPSNREGKVQEKWLRAKGGTLFLDDITEMPLSVLNKLLHRLKSCGNYQHGIEEMGPVDFRIICGTREDIGSEGASLKDYSEFFRLLAPFQVKIPSLRNRTDDIPLLIKRILNEVIHNQSAPDPEGRRGMPNITPEAMKILKAYSWPGNVRELKNVISQTFLLTDSDRIGPEDLPPSISEYKGGMRDGLSPDAERDHEKEWNFSHLKFENLPPESQVMNEGAEENMSSAGPGKKEKERAPFLTLRETETRLIRQALEYTNWNMKRTASLLGISRPALYRRIEKLKIVREETRDAPPEENNPSSAGGSENPPRMEAASPTGASSYRAG